MKIMLTFLCGILPIGFLRKFFLNLLGHNVSYKSKLGINFLFAKKIELTKDAKLGYFNFIKIDKLQLENKAYIKNLNYFKGPFNVYLKSDSGIANQNKFRRANYPVSIDSSTLTLGRGAFIVSNHFLDLTKSITIGDHSIVAGVATQFWTHGYFHESTGNGRIRIDGEIILKNNVYLGSSCIINPGIIVNSAINIGSGSVISKSLLEQGMYVGQGLRKLNKNIEDIKSNLDPISPTNSPDDVYLKTIK